jgi:DNA-binding transcriptional LysR family regulator
MDRRSLEDRLGVNVPLHPALSRSWNWLPAFRAIAEADSLHQAARQLCVTPSALSRTLQLMEDAVGESLFVRTGRSLQINAAGRTLLSSLREAMRVLDDGFARIPADCLEGPVRVASAGSLTAAFINRALPNVFREHPALIVHLSSVPQALEPLLRFEIDLSLAHVPLLSEHLVLEPLGQSPNGIYCGRGHPLHGRSELSQDELLEHPFAAPPEPPESGHPLDQWPAELPRKVVLRSTLVSAAMEMCATGNALCVLPDLMAEQARDERLFKLPIGIVPPTPIFAIRRKPSEAARVDRVSVVIEAVRREVRRVAESAAPATTG